MKKTYIAPCATTLCMQTESCIALSGSQTLGNGVQLSKETDVQPDDERNGWSDGLW